MFFYLIEKIGRENWNRICPLTECTNTFIFFTVVLLDVFDKNWQVWKAVTSDSVTWYIFSRYNITPLKVLKKPSGDLKELKPVCTCYNFLFHIGFINTGTSNKTLVRNIYFIPIIGGLVQKYYKFHKWYRCHYNTRCEKTRDAKSILKRKAPSKRMNNTECLFKLGVKILKVRVPYNIWNGMVKSVTIIFNERYTVYVYSRYICNCNYFFSVCLLWKKANKQRSVLYIWNILVLLNSIFNDINKSTAAQVKCYFEMGFRQVS